MKAVFGGLLALCLGTAGQAQEFYAGGSLDYLLPHSGDTQTVGSAIGGVGFGLGRQFDIGAEVEFGAHLFGDADFNTQRLRGWGSYDVGDVSLRVAGGITGYSFEEDDNASGFNLGVGVERDFSPRITARGEFIRDFLDDSFTAAVTTTRVGVFFNF